jgi:hypothetical protein
MNTSVIESYQYTIVPTLSVVHIQHTHAQTKKEKTRHTNDYTQLIVAKYAKISFTHHSSPYTSMSLVWALRPLSIWTHYNTNRRIKYHTTPRQCYDWHAQSLNIFKYFIKKNSVVLARKRTIPTERPQPAGEVSANFS